MGKREKNHPTHKCLRWGPYANFLAKRPNPNNTHHITPKSKQPAIENYNTFPTSKQQPSPGFWDLVLFLGHLTHRVAVMKMQRTHPSTVRKYGNSLHPSHSPVKRGEFHGFFERQKGPPNKQRLPKKQPFGDCEAWTKQKGGSVVYRCSRF